MEYHTIKSRIDKLHEISINNITITHPLITKQWHPSKNGDLKPENYLKNSSKKIWWLCEKTCKEGCKHEWYTTIIDRTFGYNCPYCCVPLNKICIHNSILYSQPDLIKQWHPTKNGDLKPEYFSICSAKKIWWLCDKTCIEGCKHEWEAIISNRTKNKQQCPFCSIPQKKLCIHNSIVHTHPDLAKQWHPIKNDNLIPNNFTAGANKIVWWLCDKTCIEGCNHEWKTSINKRVYGSNCPYCSIPKKNVCLHDSIVYTHPLLVKQWHPTKNNDLKPENVSYGSGKKIWWYNTKCKHTWKTSINNRVLNLSDCSICVNKTEKKLYNELIMYYPKLKIQYRVNWCKNIHCLPFDFVLESNKIIIELDGLQHFEQVSNWQTPEYTHKNDLYKMKCANENKFSIIRILQDDVYFDKYNWLEELKTNIDILTNEETIKNIYMCKKNEYWIFNNI